MGNHTLKAGANILYGEVNYFQNNTPGGTFTFANAPTALDGTNPGPTGDPFASFLIGQPTGGTVPVIELQLWSVRYQVYFVEDSWRVERAADVEPRCCAWRSPVPVLRDGGPPRHLQPGRRKPAFGRAHKPGNGTALRRRVRVGGERHATGAHV